MPFIINRAGRYTGFSTEVKPEESLFVGLYKVKNPYRQNRTGFQFDIVKLLVGCYGIILIEFVDRICNGAFVKGELIEVRPDHGLIFHVVL
jgi:hypothetical protein